MVAGRPRTHDRIAIGKAFVQWVKDHPDCLTVPHFTTANNIDTEMLIRWRKEDPEFRQYYIEAKDLIGINRLKANQNDLLDRQIYLMHARNFDSDIKADWKEEREFEASLKFDGQQQQTQAQIDANKAVVDAFRALTCEGKQQQAKETNTNQND